MTLKCHLARLMARDRMRVSDVARATGLNRSTITALVHDRATRVELPDVEALCRVLHCGVGDLFEYSADDQPAEAAAQEMRS